jgi:hypothetical protein
MENAKRRWSCLIQGENQREIGATRNPIPGLPVTF